MSYSASYSDVGNKSAGFTARRKANFAFAGGVYATANPSVRLYVRPSHSGIVSKRGNAEECGLH